MPGNEFSSWEDVLRSLLGEDAAAQAIEAMRAAGLDPDAMGEAAGLPKDAGQLMAMVNQMQAMLASSGDGPVNWGLAHDVARQQVHSGGDPSLSAAEEARTRQYLQVADLWLDPVTTLPPSGGSRSGLSRASWVERTLPTFQRLAEPVAASVVAAIAATLQGETERVPGLGIAGAQASDLLRRLGGAAFGMQLGSAVATLAREAFGFADIGLPLTDDGAVSLVPRNVDEFGDGLEIPSDEVAQFLAVREVAHARLYSGAPWLRSHVLGIVEAYAREIRIDTDAMERAFREIDPADPEQLREAMGSGVFALDVSEVQRRALERLETTLAVIEGWVEVVSTEAVQGQLDHVPALSELMRRRRAAGGPAEDTFKSLVGLELRPRRLRDAAQLWSTLTTTVGIEERDAVWSHPDLMPSSAELDDPKEFAASRARGSQDFDDALAALLDEEEPPS
ncbi:MAG: zinc-dependent metalloprotease [Actinobacteria bacterium]|nr:zinc-dependent metalloprotease [Actinomycetota bacterium]